MEKHRTIIDYQSSMVTIYVGMRDDILFWECFDVKLWVFAGWMHWKFNTLNDKKHGQAPRSWVFCS